MAEAGLTAGGGAGVGYALRGSRLLAAIPAIALLGFLVAWLIPVGQADWQFQPLRNDVRAWAGVGKAPTARAWEGARVALEEAVVLSPANPSLHRYLSLLHLTEPALAHSPQLAASHAALEAGLRPSAPDAWHQLILARQRAGMTQPPFERLLVEAWTLGPAEPGVQVALADAGLATWDTLGPQARTAVSRAIAAGMAFNPEQMLRISQGRGRLFPACAHVQGDKRLAQSTWWKVCAEARAG
jgi:hypothetical protein